MTDQEAPPYQDREVPPEHRAADVASFKRYASAFTSLCNSFPETDENRTAFANARRLEGEALHWAIIGVRQTP